MAKVNCKIEAIRSLFRGCICSISQVARAPLNTVLFAGVLLWPGASGTPQPTSQINDKDARVTDFEWIGDQSEYSVPSTERNASNILTAKFGEAGYQVRGDTFPMTWADDGEIYASAGDPIWGGKNDGLDVERFSGMPPRYTITRVSSMPDYQGYGGKGVKPSGMISVHGVLYLAFQNLLGEKPPAYGTKSQHGSDSTIVSSHDHGKTWTPLKATIKGPMFPGHTFGGPAFVNTGRDNTTAPDSYVYAVSTDQWDNGSNLRVGRVPADQIQNASAWEWISELKDIDHPQWSHVLERSIPVLTDARRISLPDMVYVAAIRRYILLTWRLHKDFSPADGSELTIYDGPHPWGPFTQVHHESMWESQDMNPYCPRLPLKWLKVNGGELDGWIQFSGSWRKDSPHYRSHVRQFRMRLSRPY